MFSFNSFTFPSCDKCNETWSDLEYQANQVMVKLLSDNPLSGIDFNYLLTWFDKVRIGLWIAAIYMIKNLFGIKPHFYINSGAYTKDRMLLIYKNKNKMEHLQTVGTNVPAFHFHPFCFSMIINNYGFINMSRHFLISKNLGLPYAKEEYLGPQESNLLIIEQAKDEFTYPIIEKVFNKDCTEIYQPIFLESHYNTYSSYYNTAHKKSLFCKLSKGIGEIFYNHNTNINVFSGKNTIKWIPRKAHNLDTVDFIKLIGIQTYYFQNFYMNKTKFIEPSVKAEFERNKKLSVAINNRNIDRLNSLSEVTKVQK